MKIQDFRICRSMVVCCALAMPGGLASRLEAGVVRNISWDSTGTAIVSYSWDGTMEWLSSALLVSELLPDGAVASVLSGGGSVPSAVRVEGSNLSFLISNGEARTPGSVLFAIVGVSGGVISGGWKGLEKSGKEVCGIVTGEEVIPESQPGNDVDCTNFKIEAFSVESTGEKSRLRFSWTGTGTRDVDIQWTPVLVGSDGATEQDPSAVNRKNRFAGDGRVSGHSWKTIATVNPLTTPGVKTTKAASLAEGTAGKTTKSRAGGAEATASAESSAAGVSGWIHSYAVETDEPSGFFRLVVRIPDAEAVSESQP